MDLDGTLAVLLELAVLGGEVVAGLSANAVLARLELDDFGVVHQLRADDRVRVQLADTVAGLVLDRDRVLVAVLARLANFPEAVRRGWLARRSSRPGRRSPPRPASAARTRQAGTIVAFIFTVTTTRRTKRHVVRSGRVGDLQLGEVVLAAARRRRPAVVPRVDPHGQVVRLRRGVDRGKRDRVGDEAVRRVAEGEAGRSSGSACCRCRPRRSSTWCVPTVRLVGVLEGGGDRQAPLGTSAGKPNQRLRTVERGVPGGGARVKAPSPAA